MVEVDLPHVHRGLLVRTVYILVWLGHTTRNHKSGDGKYGFFYNLVASSQATPRFYLAAVVKNREKAWEQNYVMDRKWWTQLVQTESTLRTNYVMDRKWWTQLVQTESTLRTNRVHHFRSVM